MDKTQKIIQEIYSEFALIQIENSSTLRDSQKGVQVIRK